MAESSSASANFMKSLKAVASKDWNKSRTSRNPFEVNVPTGVYTGQISKVTLVASKTDQTPIVTFVFVVVDHAEYNGEQLRVSHFIKGSARSTISEALNRMFQSFQALGYDTDNVPIDNLHILASKALKRNDLLELELLTVLMVLVNLLILSAKLLTLFRTVIMGMMLTQIFPKPKFLLKMMTMKKTKMMTKTKTTKKTMTVMTTLKSGKLETNVITNLLVPANL